MICASVERLAEKGLWTTPVIEFLRKDSTVRWLEDLRAESRRSEDETILVLLAAIRSLDLTLLDGGAVPEALEEFLTCHSQTLRPVCLTRRVQANVAERGLPLLEFLGTHWGRQRLAVTELGCSFGLIGRVLVSAPDTLRNFGRYFAPGQQRPTALPFVAEYLGIDLDPPDERWLLACIPLADLRTRVARFMFEVPASPHVRVTQGSALDTALWPQPAPGTHSVVLTSFMLYQLDPETRQGLVHKIVDHTTSCNGTWLNLDVLTDDGRNRFVLQVDGKDELLFDSDLCRSWGPHGR